MLRALVEYDDSKNNWMAIAKTIGGVTPRQCKERWAVIGPLVNRAEWTEFEDESLLREYTIHGPKWAQIAISLPGRNYNNIRNRFFALQRKGLVE
jgi:hypothetical protein